MDGRDITLELCHCPSSLQQVAIAAGCNTTTSDALVHCLRQKTENELLEATWKMVNLPIQVILGKGSQASLLEKLPGTMSAPGCQCII